MGNWVSNRDSEDRRIIALYQNHQPGDLFYGQHKAPAIAAGHPVHGIDARRATRPVGRNAHGLSTSDPTLASNKQQGLTATPTWKST
jgi:hypothetical protein